MAHYNSPLPHGVHRALILLLVVLMVGIQQAASMNIKYCSGQNTGSNFNSVFSIYQSNGFCYNTCKSNYAFAILQGSKCWCSNYIPSSTTSTGSCNQDCPGYPADKCGNESQDLYAYFALPNNPSGTAAASSSSQSSSQKPSTSSTSTTQASDTSTSSSSPPTSSPSSTTPESISSPSTTSSPSSTTSPPSAESSSTWTPTPVTTVMTITGQVRTVTLTPTNAPSSVLPVSKHGDGGFFSHAGKVAGLFVGIALLIILIAGIIFFCCWRRRQLRDTTGESTTSEEGPSRRPSRTMSENGLLSGFMGEKMASTSSRRAGSSDNEADPGKSSRYPRVVDQRLDPTSLYSPMHDNSSRASVRSLRDDQDYSRRVLRLTNPDDSTD